MARWILAEPLRFQLNVQNIYDKFFNSLKADYPGFDKWFKGKATDNAYIFEKENQLKAFLYLKIENELDEKVKEILKKSKGDNPVYVYYSQEKVTKILKNSVLKNKISHAYLFEVNGYKNKKNIALAFAKMILCPNNYSNNSKCVNCTQCKNIDKKVEICYN